MQLEFAIFANAAEVRPDGLMYVLGGGFDLVRGPAFPATNPWTALVVRVRANAKECNQNHEFLVKMFRPNGDHWAHDLGVTFTVFPNKLHPEESNVTTICLNYVDLMFPEAGEYTFRFYVDGIEIGQAKLDAVLDRSN